MRKSFLTTAIGLIMAAATPACAQTATITIENPTAIQRQELVAIAADQLGFNAGKGVVVRDAFGIERASQLTRSGQLLIEVQVHPHSTVAYTVQPGQPMPVRTAVGGRLYPERLDDISFENDRIGFRLYGPALQRRGEKGYGHDVWVKRTPELILDELYLNHPRLSFHLDYGKGLDCYAVGPTLGCGTPALIRQGKIQFPWCYQTFRIIENGPLRFSVQVNFPTAADGTTEHRILTLDKGSNFCQATVWYDGITQPTDLAAGFAIRDTDTTSIVRGADFIHYADPTIDPDRHQTQIYVAVLFPSQPVEITTMQHHALGIQHGYTGGQFHYYFGAAWSEFDVRSQDEWHARIQAFMQSVKSPLHVSITR